MSDQRQADYDGQVKYEYIKLESTAISKEVRR